MRFWVHELALDRPGSLGRNAAGAAYPTESVVTQASDIALAVTALILLSRLMLMSALAIRLDGRGPSWFDSNEPAWTAERFSCTNLEPGQ